MRMKHYRQLTQEERYQIAASKELGLSNAEIARRLSRSTSTISRESTRNRGVKGYQAAMAQWISDKRRKSADKANKRLPELIACVSDRLLNKWSPEQITGTARAAGFNQISHEWIYKACVAGQGGTRQIGTTPPP